MEGHYPDFGLNNNMKLMEFDRVLCISPHPDDVELGMLGTIMKYKDTEFHVFCLTICGAKGFDDSYKDNRKNEIHKLWKFVDCNNVTTLYSDCDYFEDKTEPGWINYIENISFFSAYDCIFIPPEQDSMFEHRLVNKFGYPLIRHNPTSLIEYHTTSTLNSWIPNLFVDIREQYETKTSAMQFFKSQLNKSYFNDVSMSAKHTNLQCVKKGIEVVEQFKTKEIIFWQ